jgi:uncharacterized repeat protein (TIGR03803 family)
MLSRSSKSSPLRAWTIGPVATSISRSAAALLLATLFSGTVSAAHTAKFTDLYSFGVDDASQAAPGAQLVQGRDGKLYGELGVNRSDIYAITAAGAESLLWQSPQSPADPDVCYTGMTVGADGAFYGTCQVWGGNNTASGAIFRFDPKGNAFKVIYTFPAFGNTASEYPSALTLGTDGNLYGTTQGDLVNIYGTVFKVTPKGVYTTLHVFQGQTQSDGANPSSVPTGEEPYSPIPLILGSDGNFYGTTDAGGLPGQQNGGTVYQITASGAVTILCYFPDGYSHLTGVTESNGKFYGQTSLGGANGAGTFYELTPGGAPTTLFSFNQTEDSAAIPGFLLTVGNDGNFYGASQDYYAGGFGPESLYRLTPRGKFANLYSGFGIPAPCLPSGSACFVNSPLFLHTNGNFYGVTAQGGSEGRGTFFGLKQKQGAFARLQFPLGKAGSSLGIFGQGFKEASQVWFNGNAAGFRVVSDTYLTANIPVGATKGYVTVMTPSGPLTSNIAFNPQP